MSSSLRFHSTVSQICSIRVESNGCSGLNLLRLGKVHTYKSASFTLTPGLLPSVATIVTTPLPVIPSSDGTLRITYGGDELVFRYCKWIVSKLESHKMGLQSGC